MDIGFCECVTSMLDQILPRFALSNPIDIHEQFEERFKSCLVAQSASQNLDLTSVWRWLGIYGNFVVDNMKLEIGLRIKQFCSYSLAKQSLFYTLTNDVINEVFSVPVKTW